MIRRQVLLVGRDPVLLRLCHEPFKHLHGGNCQVETIDYCDDALMAIRQQSFDLVLVLSLNAPWRSWPSLSELTRVMGAKSAIIFLQQVGALHIQVPILVVSQLPSCEGSGPRQRRIRVSGPVRCAGA